MGSSMRINLSCSYVFLVLLGLVLAPGSVRSQDGALGLPSFENPVGGLLGLDATSDGELILTAKLEAVKDSKFGKLTVTGEITPGWHIYSLTQPKGGPLPSTLDLEPNTRLKLVRGFKAETPPHRVENDPIFEIPVEDHEGKVVWSALVEFAEGVQPQNASATVVYGGQICNDEAGCIPLDGEQVMARFAGTIDGFPELSELSESATNRGYEAGHVRLTGHIEPAVMVPGSTGRLVVTAEVQEPYHIYALQGNAAGVVGYSPTLITFLSVDGLTITQPTVSQEPRTLLSDVIPGEIKYHDGTVSWTYPIEVPEGLAAGTHQITGVMGLQTCDDVSCDMPIGVSFTVGVNVGSIEQPGQVAAQFVSDTYRTASDAALAMAGPDSGQSVESAEEATIDSSTAMADEPSSEKDEATFWFIILLAFIGGFLLNFMPCVLPVIGLKVMSFVQQAGESRAKIFALNLWYTLGIMAVFMFLATTVAMFNIGWGELYTFDAFKLILISVLFAMGLSFLGVWEIPIPGFVGSSKANEVAEKEGPLGAFAKGVIATLLATPCSGPGLAAAVTWCTGKPPFLVYLVFVALGLGMAAPYIAIGINPRLVAFLPRPGAWMETFKQAMGFVLLAAVIFFFTILDPPMVVPTLAFLFGIWAACWWIGRIPPTADVAQKFRAWTAAIAFAGLIWIVSFSDRVGIGEYSIAGIHKAMEVKQKGVFDRELAKLELDTGEAGESLDDRIARTLQAKIESHEPIWYTKDRFRVLQEKMKKTVLIDFTADWCLTCKVLERSVLHSDAVQEALEENGVVTVTADWSKREEAVEVNELLIELGSKQIPVYAIYSVDRPDDPFVLRAGGIAIHNVLNGIEQASPSENLADAPSGDRPDTIAALER